MKNQKLKVRIELEKKHWLKKMKRSLDYKFSGDKKQRDYVIKKTLQFDKCCLIDNHYINRYLIPFTGEGGVVDEYWKESLERDKQSFERTNGLSLYSSEGGINPFMINQWFKECKSEILKRI